MENTKRDLSLDFTKPRVPKAGQLTTSLVTPTLNLSTPEINKMICDGELAVLTPNAINSIIQTNIPPSPLIPTVVNACNIPNNNTTNNNNNNNNSNINNGRHQQKNNQHKDNHRSNSTTMDMDKIEKKRERNRLAAKKCRQRKLETIDELRKDVMQWEQRYKKLELDFEQFKEIRSKEFETLQRENDHLKSIVFNKG